MIEKVDELTDENKVSMVISRTNDVKSEIILLDVDFYIGKEKIGDTTTIYCKTDLGFSVTSCFIKSVVRRMANVIKKSNELKGSK